jgi:hypothetical protein
LSAVFCLEAPPSASVNAPSIWQMDSMVQRRVSSDACRLASVYCLEAAPSASANAPSIWQMDSMVWRRVSSDAVGWHLSFVWKPLECSVDLANGCLEASLSASASVSAPSTWHRIRWTDFRRRIRDDSGVCRLQVNELARELGIPSGKKYSQI